MTKIDGTKTRSFEEQMIREPNLERPEDIGMLQDSELDLVVGGFLGAQIQYVRIRALNLDTPNPERALQPHSHSGVSGPSVPF